MIRLIKKYKNRRLYDVLESKYITFEDLQRYVLDNIAFEVLDIHAGKDITANVLLQILIEIESNTTQFLSIEILRQLIIISQHPMQQLLKGTLEQFFGELVKTNPYLENYQKVAEFWHEHLPETLKKYLKF